MRRPRRRLERLDDVPKYTFGVRGRRPKQPRPRHRRLLGVRVGPRPPGCIRLPVQRLFVLWFFRNEHGAALPEGALPVAPPPQNRLLDTFQPLFYSLPVLPLSFLLAQDGLAPLFVVLRRQLPGPVLRVPGHFCGRRFLELETVVVNTL